MGRPDLTLVTTAKVSLPCAHTSFPVYHNFRGQSDGGLQPPGILWPRPAGAQQDKNCIPGPGPALTHTSVAPWRFSKCSPWRNSHHFLAGNEVKGKHVKTEQPQKSVKSLFHYWRCWLVCTQHALVVVEGALHPMTWQPWLLILWPGLPILLGSSCPQPHKSSA